MIEREWYTDDLVCPDCRRPLRIDESACECGFVIRNEEPLDLRPQSPPWRTKTFRIGTDAPALLARTDIEPPSITYQGPRPTRDSSELFSAVASSLKRGARFLDLGCGPRDQAVAASHYELRYVGIDYSSKAADLLADAHAIPFGDESFDLVLSYAVLEHLYNPFLAVDEVARVLRRGGTFFGTVSQGEPFHESFFHHTALGVVSALAASQFEIIRLWASYDTLHSLAGMGRYPRAIRLLIELVHRLDKALPFLAPRAFFRSSAQEKNLERLYRAAGICFVARKP